MLVHATMVLVLRTGVEVDACKIRLFGLVMHLRRQPPLCDFGHCSLTPLHSIVFSLSTVWILWSRVCPRHHWLLFHSIDCIDQCQAPQAWMESGSTNTGALTVATADKRSCRLRLMRRTLAMHARDHLVASRVHLTGFTTASLYYWVQATCTRRISTV